jgi:RNA recognition motif-containing protein
MNPSTQMTLDNSLLTVKNTFVHITHATETSLPAFRRSMTVSHVFLRPEQSMKIRTDSDLTETTCISTPSSLSSGVSSLSDFLENSQSEIQQEVKVADKKKKSKKNGLRQISVDSQEELSESQWTTIILRNIPCRYTHEGLVEEIDAIGENYDFFHLPPARRRRGNLGYAFVNFVDAESAQRFIKAFEGHIFDRQPNAKKEVVIGWANLQGFEANRKFYSSTRVMKSTRCPYVKEY